jgi:hypothetical protein
MSVKENEETEGRLREMSTLDPTLASMKEKGKVVSS